MSRHMVTLQGDTAAGTWPCAVRDEHTELMHCPFLPLCYFPSNAPGRQVGRTHGGPDADVSTCLGRGFLGGLRPRAGCQGLSGRKAVPQRAVQGGVPDP